MPEDVLVLEQLPIADLASHPRNDGGHPPEEIAHLRQSIRDYDIYRNVVVAADGTILAGHGVVMAAAAEGRTHVPGKRMPYGPDDPRALGLLVGDNHIARLRTQDSAALVDLLLDLRQQDPDALLGTGFDQEALDALVVATRPPAPPEAFPAYDENIPAPPTCPRCGYQWSGGQA